MPRIISSKNQIEGSAVFKLLVLDKDEVDLQTAHNNSV